MNQNIKMRTILILTAMALLALFAGCKGESPTAPPPVTNTSGNGGGGVTPPTGATITLSQSNASPVVNSTSIITATVSVNGQPAPNGTAVEFATNNTSATFTENNDVKIIKTTTNGVATATVTSTDVGSVTVTATVNNAAKTIDVNFKAEPVAPGPPPSTAPTISSVSPNIGKPTGGELITINGNNFTAPVRVLFDLGGGVVKEGSVQSVTTTQIQVLTPPIDLTTGQTQAVAITVITQAGSTTEQRVSKTSAFTFQLAVLTPSIRLISPTSGPVDGGTRVTIQGDGFQAPVQVFFGSAQAEVISTIFNEIVVISPTARDTAPNGSGTVTGPVAVKVINGLAGAAKAATLAEGFRYINKVQVTAITPNQGPFTGGTHFRIDGIGFESGAIVTLDGIAAQVISVSSTEIIGISNGIALSSCADATGPVQVTNINNGDSGGTGISWIYRVVKPIITNVTPNPVQAGANAQITVANATGFPRILIGGVGVVVTGTVVNPNGSTTYTVQVPTTLTLTTQSCGTAGGTAQVPTSFDVQYTSLETSCTDTLVKGLTVAPPASPTLFLNPSGFTAFTATITPATAAGPGGVPPATPASVKGTSQTISIINTGAAPLTVQSITTTCGAGSNFTVPTSASPQTLNTCDALPLTISYNGSTTAGSSTCSVTITTDAGTKTFNLTGTSQ